MKFSKAEWAALAVTGLTLTALAATTLGTGGGDYVISGAHLPQATASEPARVFLPDEPVDLNTATLDQLLPLPGVGETKAQAILDYRAANGPFAARSDLLNVPGVGQATLDDLAPYITLS